MSHKNRATKQKNGKRPRYSNEKQKNNKNNKRQKMNKGQNEGISNPTSISKLSLEILPSFILDSIFQNLETTDSLKLGLLSRDLYWPAMTRIYNTICISSGSNWVNENKNIIKNNAGTLIGGHKIDYLTRTITDNMKLRYLIRTINCVDYLCLDSIKYLLSKLTSLQAFYSIDRNKVPAQSARKLKSVRCALTAVPKLTDRIVELEIFTTAHNMAPKLFRTIAHNMIELNSFENLRKLSFSEERMAESIVFGLSDQYPKYPPYWVLFFDELNRVGVKLQLSHLEILGKLERSFEKLAEILGDTVDLDILETLHLEDSRLGYGSNGEPTFLETITKHTPSLKSLAISKGMGTYSDHLDSLFNTLVKNIPHQLDELYILGFQLSEASQREFFQSIILSSQSNLVRLMFNSGFQENEGIFDRYSDIGRIVCKDWINESKRQKFCPQIFGSLHSRPYIGVDHIKALRDKRNQIQGFFEKDLIYKGAKIHLPLLEQYYNEFVFVNPQCGKVYLNEGMMSLD